MSKIITGFLCSRKKVLQKKLKVIQVKSRSLALHLQGRNRISFCRWDYLACLCVRRLQGTCQGQTGLGKTRCRLSVMVMMGLETVIHWLSPVFLLLFSHISCSSVSAPYRHNPVLEGSQRRMCMRGGHQLQESAGRVLIILITQVNDEDRVY